MAIGTMIAAFALQALPAPGSIQWEPVGEDHSGRYAIDPASMARDGDVVRFLMRAQATRPDSNGTGSAVMRMEIDCRQRTVTPVSGDFYKEDGTFAYTLQHGDGWGEPHPIDPRTNQPPVFQRVCPGR